MKHLQHASLVLLSLVLFPACAKKHDDAPAPQPVQATPPSVQGDFITPTCLVDARNQGSTMELNFAADRVVESTESFNDSACNQAAFATIITSNYKLEDVVSPGVIKIDYATVEVDLIPHTQAMADSWNRFRHCGIADWQEGQSKPVNPDGCVEGVKTNGTTYSLVKTDGTYLYLGQANQANRDEDGQTPEHRFSAIDDKTVFTKKGTPTVVTVPAILCPAFTHQYACDTGDSTFAGYDVGVATNNANGGIEFLFSLTRPGHPSSALKFDVNGQTYANPNGSFTESQTDSCAQSVLVSRTITSRQGDPNYSRLLERHFALDATDGHLVITTITQETTDPRNPGPSSSVQTNCRVF